MNEDPQTKAFRQGKQTGLAIAAIASGAVAYISLLGLEKALLAMVLAILAIHGATEKSRTRRLAAVAIGLAGLYVVTFVVLLALFHDRFGELVCTLQEIS